MPYVLRFAVFRGVAQRDHDVCVERRCAQYGPGCSGRGVVASARQAGGSISPPSEAVKHVKTLLTETL